MFKGQRPRVQKQDVPVEARSWRTVLAGKAEWNTAKIPALVP